MTATPNAELTRDIAHRLTGLIETVDTVLGSDLITPTGRQLVHRVHERAETYAANLTGARPAAARAAKDLAQLVDLDDVDDAASPLGIAIGLTRPDAVTQAFAAAVLGISRARVNVLANAGRLRIIETDDGGRMVARADVAARLAARNQPDT